MLHTAHTASTNAFTVGETIERASCSWAPAAAAYWPRYTTEREEGDTWCSEEEALCVGKLSLQNSNHSYISTTTNIPFHPEELYLKDCKQTKNYIWEKKNF